MNFVNMSCDHDITGRLKKCLQAYTGVELFFNNNTSIHHFFLKLGNSLNVRDDHL